MSKYYYEKGGRNSRKKLVKHLGIVFSIIGLMTAIYIFYPLILWQIFFEGTFASPSIQAPIPRSTVVNPETLGSLISQAGNLISGVDYTNARNWFPGYGVPGSKKAKVPYYSVSIPKLNIKNATVSTVDTNLSSHLVNYPGTPAPSEAGNAVVFGHSTLPQLFNPNDYKTIFANAYQLKQSDIIYVNIASITYKYRIFNISVVDPDNTSIFNQDASDSYLTLVTCTPPGTVWKRLIIKSKLEKI